MLQRKDAVVQEGSEDIQQEQPQTEELYIDDELEQQEHSETEEKVMPVAQVRRPSAGNVE